MSENQQDCVQRFGSEEHLQLLLSEFFAKGRPSIDWMCPKCAATRSTLEELETHFKIVHLEWYPFVCPFCERRTASESDMRDHYETDHGKMNEPEFVYRGDAKATEALLEMRNNSIWEMAVSLANRMKTKDKERQESTPTETVPLTPSDTATVVSPPQSQDFSSSTTNIFMNDLYSQQFQTSPNNWSTCGDSSFSSQSANGTDGLQVNWAQNVPYVPPSYIPPPIPAPIPTPLLNFGLQTNFANIDFNAFNQTFWNNGAQPQTAQPSVQHNPVFGENMTNQVTATNVEEINQHVEATVDLEEDESMENVDSDDKENSKKMFDKIFAINEEHKWNERKRVIGNCKRCYKAITQFVLEDHVFFHLAFDYNIFRYRCLINSCSFKHHRIDDMRIHLKAEHNLQEDIFIEDSTADHYQRCWELSRELVMPRVAREIDKDQPVGQPPKKHLIHCLSCRRTIYSRGRVAHIFSHMAKEKNIDRYSCGICGFSHFFIKIVKNHGIKAHGTRNVAVDHAPNILEELEEMCKKCFGEYAFPIKLGSKTPIGAIKKMGKGVAPSALEDSEQVDGTNAITTDGETRDAEPTNVTPENSAVNV